MSEEGELRRWRVEVSPTRRACVVEVIASDEDAALRAARELLDADALTEGATWEVRPI